MIYPADKKLSGHEREAGIVNADLIIYSQRQLDGSYISKNASLEELGNALGVLTTQYFEDFRTEELTFVAGVAALAEPPRTPSLVSIFYTGVQQTNVDVSVTNPDFSVSAAGIVTLEVGSDIPTTGTVTAVYTVAELESPSNTESATLFSEEMTFSGGDTIVLSDTPVDDENIHVYYTGIFMNNGTVSAGQADFTVNTNIITRDALGNIPALATVIISYSRYL